MKSSNLDKRIRFFNLVRDISYYVATGDEQDYSCATKPFLLDILLRSIGLEVRHVLCTFFWNELGLSQELIKLPHDLEETHEYLLVLIPENNRWVIVDPTWDSRIKHPRISISVWDGLTDTSVAVPIQRLWSPEESEKLIEEEENRSEEDRAEYMKRNKDFLVAFNQWLDTNRCSL